MRQPAGRQGTRKRGRLQFSLFPLSFLRARRKLSRTDIHVKLASASGVDERELQAPVAPSHHLGRYRARDDLIARRQHDAVARYSERPLEHNRITFGVIAFVVLVRLNDRKPILAARGHRMSEVYLDVLARWVEALGLR